MTNPLVSVVVVTNRNPKEYLDPLLRNLYSSPNAPSKFEVLVYAPVEVLAASQADFPNISHIPEIVKSGGALYGYNLLTREARGKYVLYLTDDLVLPDDFWECVPHLDKMTDRRFRLCGFDMDDGPGDGMKSCFPDALITHRVGFRQSDIDSFADEYERFGREVIVARYLLGWRDTIWNELGGYLFHPSFIQGCGDHYLGFYIWKNGESIRESTPCTLSHRGNATSNTQWWDHDAMILSDLIHKHAVGLGNYV